MKKTYACKKCGKQPLTRSELVEHYKQEHGGFESNKKKTKRIYTKREVKPSVEDVNFCPRCGCNIKAVQAAMTL